MNSPQYTHHVHTAYSTPSITCTTRPAGGPLGVDFVVHLLCLFWVLSVLAATLWTHIYGAQHGTPHAHQYPSI